MALTVPNTEEDPVVTHLMSQPKGFSAWDNHPDAEEDPVVAQLMAQHDREKSRLKGSLYEALDTNPDQYATQQRIAKQLGYPTPVLEALPELAKDAKLMQIEKGLAEAPRLKQKLAEDAAFAKLAHDDTDNLSLIEKALRKTAGALEFTGRSFGAGATDLAGGAATLTQGLLETIGVGTSEAEYASLLRGKPKELKQGLENNAAFALPRFARAMTLKSKSIMDGMQTDEGKAYQDLKYQTLDADKAAYLSPIKMIGDAMRSLPSTAAMAATVYFTRGAAKTAEANAIAAGLSKEAATKIGIEAAAKTASLMGATSEGAIGYAQQKNSTALEVSNIPTTTVEQSPEYQELLTQGFTPETARVKLEADTAEQSGISAGIVDAAVNAVGGRFLGKILGESGGVVKRAGKGALNEATTELVQSAGEQLGQNASVLQNLDPTQQLSSGVVESALQGFFVGGLTGGTFTGVVSQFDKQNAQAEQAPALREALQQLDELSKASQVKARDPETFQQFVASAMEDGPVQDVYVDAQVLAQSGVAEQLAQVSPAVKEQFDEALATGGSIRIPFDEYAAQIAGTEFNQSLIDHLKTDPNGFTFSESKEYAQTYQEEFSAALNNTLQEQEADASFKDSAATVQSEIARQLTDIGRYTSDVTDANALVAASHYAVRAAQLGMTPEELFNSNPLTITGQSVTGDSFNQDGTLQTETDNFKNWFGNSAVVNSEGAPLVVYHGTDQSFDTFDQAKTADTLFWFTSDKQAIENGEVGAAGKGDIMPVYLSLKNPATRTEYDKYGIDELISKGYDGIQLEDGAYVAFNPEQIKSATGNNGNFDPNDSNILNQSTPEQEGVAKLFQTLTKNDEIFQYGKSTATDMQQVFNDVIPGVVKVDLAIAPEGIDEQYKVYPINTAGKVLTDQEGIINVYPDGKVEINVANWQEGYGGSGVYAAVGNWAFTNGKVFAGDRDGISAQGAMRRLENIISLALKFGTTDFIAPHPSQMRELGFDWKEGDTEYNLNQMLQASYKAIRNGTYVTETRHGMEVTYKSPNAIGVAKLDDLVYDFDKQQFIELSSGKQFTDEQFSGLARSRGARASGAGSRTLKRAALGHTFLQELDARKLDGLRQLTHQSLADTQLHKVFYQQKRGSFNPSANTISLLKNADLSTFLHELGHSFLEMDVNLASQLIGNKQLTVGEQEIVDDVAKLFNWFGIQGNINAQLDQWYAMSLDEQRAHHEKLAEGFETYLFEGKAPSLELQPLFQRMRAWFMNVYRNMMTYLTSAGETLTPEVRAVFDRMLASTEQIKLAQQARSMLPLFETADQAGMTPEEFASYQRLDPQATQEAIAELQTRGLRDMQWLSNARGKQLKKLQKEAASIRREVRSAVTSEIMSEPVYRAWTFLTAKLSADDKISQATRKKSDPNVVDETQDTLFTAIAKLGGINKDDTVAEWGTDSRENPQSGVFGKPVWRKQGGLSLDAMAELLAERGYLPVDKNGKYDLRDFEERFSEQAKGVKQVSLAYDYSQDQEDLAGVNLNTEALGAGRLDRASLQDAYGSGEGSALTGLNNLRMTSANGLHQDIVAEMFGFTSGDQLVKALLEAQPPRQAIEDATDVRMLESYGDLATPEALERAADQAIHNDVRARMISTELNALAKATGKRATLASAAREFANGMIARLKVRDIKPSQYTVAEAKAAKNAATALRKGDLETASAEKRNQLVSNYATKAAHNAKDEVDGGVRYLRKFAKEGVRKGLDVDYLDQIDALLERFDLRTGVSLKNIDQRDALVDWVTKQRDQGLEPDIPRELMNEALRMSYKNMTVEAFRGLVDSVKQIEHLGRLKNRLLTAKDQRTYEAIRDGIAASIIENAGDREAETRTPTTNSGRALQGLKNFWASHIKAATWARVMDGGKDGGAVWEYFIRSANESADFETSERGKATEALSNVLAPVFKLGKMGGKGQYFQSIDRSLNRESRIAIALNTGNASNLQRLLGGEGWTPQQLKPVLDSLTKAEWDAVQSIWDHFETYRPQIAAKERRVYGKEPNWIEPTPILTSHGEYRGGYYPIKYDPNASQRAEEHVDAEGAKRQIQGAYTSATTRRSFTKTRVEEVTGRPLLYTLGGVYSGVNDVIHDLAWHEWLIDVNRLMRSSTIDSAIRNHYGPEAKRQFKSWIQDMAEGERGADNAGEMVLGKLRQGVSIAGLGFNVMSAAIQITGFSQSVVRIGAKWVGRGVSKYVASPIQSTREVTELSEFMASRFRTQFRELNELRNQVQDQSTAKRALQDGAYFMMTHVQQMVDVPTWLGAYEKAISEGNTEERAIALADQGVIDSQMSGMSKDLSAIERGGPALKLFTVFYSFMNTTFNLGVMRYMTEANKAKLAADYLLLYVATPVLGMAIKNALTPGDADDEWDLEVLAKALLAESLGFMMGQMIVVREFAEGAKTALGLSEGGFGYQGPAGVRVVTDATKFAQQAQQGEFDDAFRKASINLLGSLFGLPAAQVNRSITGAKALAEGETDNPAAVLFGYQEPR